MTTAYKKSRASYPDGVLAIYDNGGRTADRYCAVFAPIDGWFTTLYMSVNPSHPQGIGLTGEHRHRPTRGRGDRTIGYDELPEGCRQLVDDWLRS